MKKHLSLASRYRPQTFAEVVGQHLATSALSRAAAEDKVAPAYLLSGTRGVGKTTIARIFAKALNCEHAPAAEPCNTCSQCAHILAGVHVDVNEIDGASNTGVEDVRALREKIGYQPMEGRYRIFIIDEAHMLSKSAFNALLKTLEEPPDRTVFIFATTEVHRFPPTIVSRCQHFVFRHLPEDMIFGHLDKILEKENIPHDADALRLIARRAAGSVRDSLSLLDQCLALGGNELTSSTVRESLGLAGRDFFDALFAALAAQDCGRILELCANLLHAGVDLGFFTRELSANLRNLFLFRQIGDSILPSLSAPPDEIAFLRKHAPAYTPAHLHAAWQMTLENQRGIAMSPEPGAALELLLLNLALLPRLLPVDNAGAMPPPPVDGTAAKTAPGRESHAVREYACQERTAPDSAGAGSSSGSGHGWEGYCQFCQEERDKGENVPSSSVLRLLRCAWLGNRLELSSPNMTHWKQALHEREVLRQSLARYCGKNAPEIVFIEPRRQRTREELAAECENKWEIELCRKILGAKLADCQPK